MRFYKSIFVLFGVLFTSQICFGYTGGPQNGIDVGINARATSRMNFQIGTGSTFIMRFGTTTVTGSGTAGYMMGTDTAYPRWVWTPATNRMNFLDITLQQNGVDIAAYGNSAALAAALSDETGTNTVVYSSSPTINNPTFTGQTAGIVFSAITGSATASQLPTSLEGMTFTGNTNFPSGIWNSSGNVGIGDISPQAKLQVTAASSGDGIIMQRSGAGADVVLRMRNELENADSNRAQIRFGGTNEEIAFHAGDGTTEHMRITSSGVGIGTTTPGKSLDISGDYPNFPYIRLIRTAGAGGGAGNTYGGIQWLDSVATKIWGIESNTITGPDIEFNEASTNRMVIKAGGNVGIGTPTPSTQFHTTGGVRFATLGAGAVQSDANGNLSVSSDERLKDIQGTFTSGLGVVLGIEPISYKYNKLIGLDMENTYVGFSAQNVMQYIPEAVAQDAKGYYTLNDRPIVASLVNCIKELQSQIDAIKIANNITIKEYKASPITSKKRLIYSTDIIKNDIEDSSAKDTHEYRNEGTEDDWVGILNEDAFETITIYEDIQTGTETSYVYRLEGTSSVRVAKTIPIYERIETEKSEIKLKQDVKFDTENGMFYQKVTVPKLVYKLKAEYTYKEGKYFRKETIEEARIRVGR